MKKYIITSNVEIAEEAYMLKFERDFNFIPGQILQITVKETIPPRMYSICSANNDKDVSILYSIKKEGVLTPNLAQLKKGDEILVSQPSGTFKSISEPAYWIATGTGIAPFLSMLLSEDHRNKVVIQGAKDKEHLYFSDIFTTHLGDSYRECCSQIESENTFSGRVSQFLNQTNNFPTNQKYYLCGSAEMVVEVRDILISKGIPFFNIVSEIYF